MYHSTIMPNAERLSQPAIPQRNQKQQGTRIKNSIEVHERNSMQIQAQLGFFSVSEGSQTPRTQCRSVLGKRNITEVLATGEANIIMQTNEHTSIVGPGFPESMRVPDHDMLRALQAETGHQLFLMLTLAPGINQIMGQAATPLDMSDQFQQPLQPMQSKQTSQESFEMIMDHDPYSMLIQKNKGREPSHPFRVRSAQFSFLQPSNHNSQATPQAPIEKADDGIFERLLRTVAVTQRHNLDRGKQAMSNQLHHRSLVLSRIPLVAELLQQSSATEISSDHTRTDKDAYIFVKGNGPVLKARRSLLICKKPTTEVHDCRIIHDIDLEATSFFTLATKKQVDVFIKQFADLMYREGFKDFYPKSVLELHKESEDKSPKQPAVASAVAASGIGSSYAIAQSCQQNSGLVMRPGLFHWQPTQYDGKGWMTTGGPYGAGFSSINNMLHGNAVMGIQRPQFQQSLANLSHPSAQSNEAAAIITQADLEYPWLFTIAGNQTARVPILLPYSTFRVERLGSLGLAGSYQLPPIPSGMVVPVHTPCIISMEVASILLSMARSQSHSGQIIQLLRRILGNRV